MNKHKEELIRLINEFVALAKTLDSENADDNAINDELNIIALKIEQASIPVFGFKVNMDFGMINAIYETPELIIKSIEEYET